MSAATWRQFFSFNKYSQITASALRRSLNETERLAVERRGVTNARYQTWEKGQAGQQVLFNPPVEEASKPSA
ncbi:hypothetical protein BDM02DRAFT_3184499 [Thelephora ganbajun]|uniref:Uncharacterized protein n=1 Tax=Thelephora ganbajun TaxID=370292 RepID=A0ACB6ZQ07_THEGA|nr:hypothetical protein BDM02DRAFT_3184499 [Thelephora ganbajun]